MSSGTQALARHLRCQNCQYKALNTFASFAGLTIASPRPKHRLQTRPSARPFATARSLRSINGRPDAKGSLSQNDEVESEILSKIANHQDVEAGEDEPLSSLATSTPQDPSMPWYLQPHDGSRTAVHVSKQQLPELPDDSPSNLQAMMENLYTDIGLDDLRILDLRAMDPPPALGSNLLMVIGTARSEKHLHVSADRFCRWLRSTYKLRPYADGLLGRNELKLRLKRKAKRMKLLGSRGTPQEDTDDGIRTGWVCVNVGAIEEQINSRQQELDAAGIVGFSDAQDGVHLIVQMMTESKREELDLEKLWLDALALQKKKDQKLVKSPEVTQESPVEAVQVGSEDSLSTSSADTVLSSHPSRFQGLARQQTRGFHTGRKVGTEAQSTSSFDFNWHEKLSGSQFDSFKDARQRWQSLEERGMSIRLEAFWEIERPRLSERYESSLETLQALSEDGTIEVLGTGPHDLESTPFLRKCFSQTQVFPGESYWTCRIWIAFYGMLLGHPAYSPAKVQDLFSIMESELVRPSAHFYRLALEAFAPCSNTQIDPLPEFPETPRLTLVFIVSAMRRLQALTPNLDMGFIFERLHLAKLRYLLFEFNNSEEQAHDNVTEELKKLHAIAGSCGSFHLSEGFHLNALDILAEISPDLEPFLAHWSTIPIYSGSRTAAQYTLFFDRLAQNGNMRTIEGVLEDTLEIMRLETPAVATEGDVAAAITECLKIIDPDVEKSASSPRDYQGRYAKIWRQCHRKVDENAVN